MDKEKKQFIEEQIKQQIEEMRAMFASLTYEKLMIMTGDECLEMHRAAFIFINWQTWRVTAREAGIIGGLHDIGIWKNYLLQAEPRGVQWAIDMAKRQIDGLARSIVDGTARKYGYENSVRNAINEGLITEEQK